jgi:hypothetical protein
VITGGFQIECLCEQESVPNCTFVQFHILPMIMGCFPGLARRNDTQKQQQAQGGRLCCSCLGCQSFRGFRESKKGSSSGTGMEVAKLTISSSVGPLLHLFLCLLSESCSIQQEEALDALILSLQGQQRSLEKVLRS